ncbi:MAG: YeeE/YedE thiosulfate transporter family protein [Steroidobacteraceae bacterium]
MTTGYWNALFGGMLIGAGAAALLLLNGQIAGISSIFGNTIRGTFGAKGWRVAFLIGLVLPAAIVGLGHIEFAQGLPVLALSGLLVGFGTRLGSGCTSGHGVCGLSNLSLRSLLATLTFMIIAALTVFLLRHGGLLWHS